MRLIDADAFKEWLMKNSINERELEESRQIGIWIDAFPSAESKINKQELIRTMNAGIIATNTEDVYSCGMRNGIRWCRALLEDDPPKFEDASQYAELERHYCRECKWSRCHINVNKYGKSETYWHCLNWDGGTDEEGFCHEWERREDGRLNLERGCDN